MWRRNKATGVVFQIDRERVMAILFLKKRERCEVGECVGVAGWKRWTFPVCCSSVG